MNPALIKEFVEVAAADTGYGKSRFLALGRQMARQIAKDLQLPQGSFEVKGHWAGDGTPGEVTLHTEKLYLDFVRNPVVGHKFMYRRCNGRKDFVGKGNNWALYSELQVDYPRLLSTFRALHDVAAVANPAPAPARNTGTIAAPRFTHRIFLVGSPECRPSLLASTNFRVAEPPEEGVHHAALRWGVERRNPAGDVGTIRPR
jgi:hypothetical protein